MADEDIPPEYRAAKNLLDRLIGSPKTKRKQEALIKELWPETNISADNDPPEIKETASEVAALRKEFKEHLEALRNKADDDATEAAWQRLRAQGFTDKGIEWVQKAMVERKIGDPEAAAALYEKQHPPEPMQPAGFQPQGWGIGANPDKNPDIDRAFQDTDNYYDEVAAQVLREEAAKRR